MFYPWFRHLIAAQPEFRFDRYLDNVSVWIDPKNQIELKFVCGVYDRRIQNIIKRFVRSGDNCLDVGANVGGVALALAKQVGPTGQVHCFEPGPPFAERLRRNLEINPNLARRVSVHEVGLSNEAGTLRWSQDPEHPWNGGFVPRDVILDLPVKTLDEFVRENRIDRVDFIKIDTEGMELEVLVGGRDTLLSHRPVLVLETLMFFDGELKLRKQLQEFLTSVGYSLFTLTGATPRRVSYPSLPSNSLALHRAHLSAGAGVLQR